MGYGEFSAAGVDAQQPCEMKVSLIFNCEAGLGNIATECGEEWVTYHGVPCKVGLEQENRVSHQLVDKVVW